MARSSASEDPPNKPLVTGGHRIGCRFAEGLLFGARPSSPLGKGAGLAILQGLRPRHNGEELCGPLPHCLR